MISNKRLCIATTLFALLLVNCIPDSTILAKGELKPKITAESKQVRNILNKDAVYYCGSTGNDLRDLELECVEVVAIDGRGLAIYVNSNFAYRRPIKLIYEMLNKAQVEWKKQTGKVVPVILVTSETQKWVATIEPNKVPFMMDEYCAKNAW